MMIYNSVLIVAGFIIGGVNGALVGAVIGAILIAIEQSKTKDKLVSIEDALRQNRERLVAMESDILTRIAELAIVQDRTHNRLSSVRNHQIFRYKFDGMVLHQWLYVKDTDGVWKSGCYVGEDEGFYIRVDCAGEADTKRFDRRFVLVQPPCEIGTVVRLLEAISDDDASATKNTIAEIRHIYPDGTFRLLVSAESATSQTTIGDVKRTSFEVLGLGHYHY